MVRNFRQNGFLLPWVLAVVVAMSIVALTLMKIPGSLNAYIKRTKDFVCQAYLAESSFLAKLESYPEGFFKEVPPVTVTRKGPWQEWCAPIGSKNLCLLLGMDFRKMAYEEWVNGMEFYKSDLRERISRDQAHVRYSGNKRYFEMKEKFSMTIENGDLLLDLDGHVTSGNAVVEGNVLVKGQGNYDTLRVVSGGNLTLSKSVNVNYLEAVVGYGFVSLDKARFSGVVMSKNIELENTTSCDFPCVLVAMGAADSRIIVKDKATVNGFLAAPGAGRVEKDVPTQYVEVPMLPFLWDGHGKPWTEYVRP